VLSDRWASRTTLDTYRAKCPNTSSLNHHDPWRDQWTGLQRSKINYRWKLSSRPDGCRRDHSGTPFLPNERKKRREREISGRSRNDARDKSTAINLSWIPFRVVRASQPTRAGSVAFIARSAVDSDRLQGVTMCGQVVDRRSSERKSTPSGMTPSWEFPGLLIFISRLLRRYLFILALSPLAPRNELRASGLRVRRLASIITWSIR